jgi:hypothetical protein
MISLNLLDVLIFKKKGGEGGQTSTVQSPFQQVSSHSTQLRNYSLLCSLILKDTICVFPVECVHNFPIESVHNFHKHFVNLIHNARFEILA